MRLEGRAAIVTGAAQGLGLAIAERFVAEGARVVLADVNAAKVRDSAARLAGAGRAVACVADVKSRAAVDDMVRLALAEFGQIDILVNNAGGAGDTPAIEIEDVGEEAWDDVIDQNLKGTYLCCRAVVPHMKGRRFGRIVNMSSGLAKGVGRVQGTGGALLAYASAKAGILGFTYTLAKVVAKWNIMVNAVVPGFMLTEPGARVRGWFDTLPDAQKEALLSRSSIGRAGRPDELASAVLYLSSEECSYVSGVALDVHAAG
jgi:NAD(P)-dependent dehydrogenase (short-subunit alcohol dehydrogenase family)